MEVDVGDALADDIVQREPGPGIVEGDPLGCRDAPPGQHESAEEIGRDVDQVRVVPAGKYQRVPREDRPVVENGEQVGLVEDDVAGQLAGDDAVEDTRGHAAMLAGGCDRAKDRAAARCRGA
jgi:hypothetical protein